MAVSFVEHDLVGGDSHLFHQGRNRAYCNCFGPCCFNSHTLDCVCEECDCEQHAGYCPPADALPLAVVVVPPLKPKFEHACKDCGAEVFRNGTRGRFPSRCPSCKEKK